MRHDIATEVNRSQIELIFSSRLFTTVMMTACAIFIYLLMRDYSPVYLSYWLVFMLGVDSYRIVTAILYTRANKAGRVDPAAARNTIIRGTLLSGLGWGACSIILYPHLDIFSKLVLSLCIIGVATASTTTLAYKKYIAYLYISLIILPLIATIIRVDSDPLVLSSILIFYYLFLVKTISVFYQNSQRLITLELTALEREQEVKKQREKAVKANAAKSEFLANISHELRTPMHAILGFSELCMLKSDSSEKDKLVSYCANIHENGQRLLGLLNNLLDLSRLEAGRVLLDKTNNDMLQSIKGVTRELESLFKERSLNLEYQVDTDDTAANYDQDKIIQVIWNLLSNAIKFSPLKSTVTINIRGSRLTGANKDAAPALEVSITDEGEGVPEAELEKIFSKFVQSSSNKTAGGTGLGLSISREIIELHGGEIAANNMEGGGAVFRFAIPRQ